MKTNNYSTKYSEGSELERTPAFKSITDSLGSNQNVSLHLAESRISLQNESRVSFDSNILSFLQES